jgi:hypothetical protein
MAVRGPHHCDVGQNAIEPDEAVHRASPDLRLALQLQTEFVKESAAAARSSITTPTLSILMSVMPLNIPLTAPVQTAAADGRVR